MLKQTILATAMVMALSPLTLIAHAGVTIDPIDVNGSVDFNLDDIDSDDIEQQVKLRDVMARMDIHAASWLAARLQLACEGTLAVENGTTCDFKNATVGISHTLAGQAFVVSVGKQTMPFGGNVSQRAINRNDELYALNKQTERKMGVVIAIAPNIGSDAKMAKVINDLFSLVEVGAYNGASDGSLDLGQLGTLDSYATRVSGAVGSVFTQISYLDQKDGEKRFGVAASTALLSTGFDIYGEWQKVENSTLNPGLKSAATVGIARDFKGYKASAEYTKMNSTDSSVRDRMAVSATKDIGKHITLGAELSADKDLKDRRAMITASAKLGRSASAVDNDGLFPELKRRTDERNRRLAELSKANK